MELYIEYLPLVTLVNFSLTCKSNKEAFTSEEVLLTIRKKYRLPKVTSIYEAFILFVSSERIRTVDAIKKRDWKYSFPNKQLAIYHALHQCSIEELKPYLFFGEKATEFLVMDIFQSLGKDFDKLMFLKEYYSRFFGERFVLDSMFIGLAKAGNPRILEFQKLPRSVLRHIHNFPLEDIPKVLERVKVTSRLIFSKVKTASRELLEVSSKYEKLDELTLKLGI